MESKIGAELEYEMICFRHSWNSFQTPCPYCSQHEITASGSARFTETSVEENILKNIEYRLGQLEFQIKELKHVLTYRLKQLEEKK